MIVEGLYLGVEDLKKSLSEERRAKKDYYYFFKAYYSLRKEPFSLPLSSSAKQRAEGLLKISLVWLKKCLLYFYFYVQLVFKRCQF